MAVDRTQEKQKHSIAQVAVVAGCLIKKDDKFLLVQEKKEKAYGLWNLPAGHVDSGETIEHTAKRETHEETGYEVKLGKKIGIYHEATDRPVKHIFEANIIDGKLDIREDEILDAQWLSRDEIESLKNNGLLRADWIWSAIKLSS